MFLYVKTDMWYLMYILNTLHPALLTHFWVNLDKACSRWVLLAVERSFDFAWLLELLWILLSNRQVEMEMKTMESTHLKIVFKSIELHLPTSIVLFQLAPNP